MASGSADVRNEPIVQEMDKKDKTCVKRNGAGATRSPGLR
jgi:hypothetical protein